MYTPPGVVEGELVFCNAGMEQDLQLLDSMNITVKDRIVLLKGQGGSVSSSKLTKGTKIERFSFEKHFKRKIQAITRRFGVILAQALRSQEKCEEQCRLIKHFCPNRVRLCSFVCLSLVFFSLMYQAFHLPSTLR